MPQTLVAAQIIPFAGIAVSAFFHSFNKPHYILNAHTQQPEIHILPWVFQIIHAFAYLSYGQLKSDIFLYLQVTPAFLAGLSHSLHWHPFYNKRIRKFHEYLLFFGIALFCAIASGTTVYCSYQGRNMDIATGASGAMVVLSGFLMLGSLIIEKWRLLNTGMKPRAFEAAVGVAGFLYGGLWTAYGFYGIQDWVICATGIMVRDLSDT